MEFFLLVLGGAVFAVLTLNYLRIAFQTTNLWLLLGVLFPPSWIAFYSVFWDRYRIQAIAHGVSFVAVVLFSALYIRAYPFEFEQTALAPLRDGIAPAFAETPYPIDTTVFATDGEMSRYLIPGRKRAIVKVDQKKLRIKRAVISNQVLRFKTRSKADEELEVAIDLSTVPSANENIISLDLTPDVSKLPAVYVIKRSLQRTKPSISFYDHGYWLELSLDKMGEHQYDGFINLKLPDGAQSFVAGYFDAYDVDLMWQYGEVDRYHDSNDTIEYVAEQYLNNKLGSALHTIDKYSDTFFQTGLDEPSGRTTIAINMIDGTDHRVTLNLFKGGTGWTVENSLVRELITLLQTITKAPPAAINRQTIPIQISVFSIDEVDTLVGRSVVIVTQDGRTREGIVSAVDRYNVSLTNPMAGGSMAMLVRRREVKEIRVKD